MKHNAKSDDDATSVPLFERPYLRGSKRCPVIHSELIQDLGLNETRVLLALSMHADERGRCFPSVDTLAAITGIDKRAVQRSLRSLEMDGVILSFPRAERRGLNLYELQPHPGTYFDERADEEHGPGGFTTSITYTDLCILSREYPWVRFIPVPRGELRNSMIDAMNANRDRDDTREPILTPGVRLVHDPAIPADASCVQTVNDHLESLIIWTANGLLPWSCLRCIVYKVNEIPQDRIVEKYGPPSERQVVDLTA